MITGLPLVMGITTIVFATISLLSATLYIIFSNVIGYYFEGDNTPPECFVDFERGLYGLMRGMFTCAIVWFVITSLLVAMIV